MLHVSAIFWPPSGINIQPGWMRVNLSSQITKRILMHVNLGYRCFILVAEEGQNMREKCSIFYTKVVSDGNL
jgi:hypothetical protein